MVVLEETASQAREGRWSLRGQRFQDEWWTSMRVAPQSSQVLSENMREMSQGSALPRDEELSN